MAQMKRSPDAGTSGLLTREDCSRRESQAEPILECINRADCDHLYQRVTQCARAFPALKPAWSTKAAARNYYGRRADMTACYASFLLKRYHQTSLKPISDNDLVVDFPLHLSDRAGFVARVRLAYRPIVRSLARRTVARLTGAASKPGGGRSGCAPWRLDQEIR